jgi:hypothetical protein
LGLLRRFDGDVQGLKAKNFFDSYQTHVADFWGADLWGKGVKAWGAILKVKV